MWVARIANDDNNFGIGMKIPRILKLSLLPLTNLTDYSYHSLILDFTDCRLIGCLLTNYELASKK